MAAVEDVPFGFLLRRRRLEAGFTQEELAERAGLSTRAVSDLERGVSVNPRPFTVRQLLDALELSPGDRREIEQAAWRANAAGTEQLPTAGFLGALPAGELVARDREMSPIYTALDVVAEGSGQFLLLGGEAGAGKTRLLQEVVLEAQRRSFLVLIGRCYPTESETPFYPLPAILQGLENWAAAQSGNNHLKEPQSRLQAALDSSVVGSSEQLHLFEAIATVLRQAAQSSPLVVLIDDVELGDPGTVKLLTFLARATRGSAILLVATFCDVDVGVRNPDLAAELHIVTRERLAHVIVVRRLSLEETGTLAASLMGSELSEEFAGFVYRRTKGLPLLITDLIWSLGGRLELRGEIGAGSMGRVFRAYDTATETLVAAKLVLARAGIELDDLLRFQQESAVLAALDHPNIVRIYDTFTEQHATCIVMELLDGQSLGQVIRDGPLDLARVKGIGLQVASALAYAHGQSIIHRDIKPDNIMLLDGDKVKVTDFGIARILPLDAMMGTVATTGMRIGTPLYMAPEQIKDKKLDGRTDVYALGATLYHLVAGRPPFDGDDALAIAVQQVNDRAPLPSTVNPSVPGDWDAAIMKALSKDPAKRYQSIKAMGERIESLSTVPAPAALRRIMVWRWPSVAAALVLIAAVLGGWLFYDTQAAPVQGETLTSYLSTQAARGRLSGTVLVARAGKVIVDNGYGEASGTMPNTPSTNYGLADATTSSLNAADTLQATQPISPAAGGLVATNSICADPTAIPNCPARWRVITVASLIRGTSRLPDFSWGQVGNDPLQSLATCQSMPLMRPRIVPVHYSTCANLVMALITPGVAASHTFRSWLPTGIIPTVRARYPDRLIFDGLSTGRLARQLYDSPIPGLALDYPRDRSHQRAYNDYFAAYSTASDLYEYDTLLFSGMLMSRANTALIKAARGVAAPHDPGIDRPRWAFGWKTGRVGSRDVVYTWGALNHYETANLRFPSLGLTVIVMSNNQRTNALAVAVRAAALVTASRPGKSRNAHIGSTSALLGTYTRPVRNGDTPALRYLRATGNVLGIPLPAPSPAFGGPPTFRGRTLTLVVTRRYFSLGANQPYAATPAGGLLLRGGPLGSGIEQHMCTNQLIDVTPIGTYRWSVTGPILTITKVSDRHCADRAATVPAKWIRVR
jgi:transcriptional regulator with XRE-family HTH domain